MWVLYMNEKDSRLRFIDLLYQTRLDVHMDHSDHFLFRYMQTRARNNKVLLRLLSLLTAAMLRSLAVPTLPASLDQVFAYHKITDSQKTSDSQLSSPLDPPSATEEASDQEPTASTHEASGTTSENLSRGMIVQVDPASRNGSTSKAEGKHDQYSEQDRDVGVGTGGSLAVAEKEEEGEVYGEKGHKLGVGRWHSVALAGHLCSKCQLKSHHPIHRTLPTLTLRSLLLDDTFQDKVQSFTTHLSNEHQDHFHLSG